MLYKFIKCNRNHVLKLLLLFLSPAVLSAQNLRSSFDKYLNAESALYGYNGNVLVAKSGKIIYQRSFGLADFSTKKN